MCIYVICMVCVWGGCKDTSVEWVLSLSQAFCGFWDGTQVTSCGLNEKCVLRAQVLNEHLVPSWWCCSGKLRNRWELGDGWRSKVTVTARRL